MENIQTKEETKKAKLLFENTFKINPNQYDEYGVYDVQKEAEIYVCKETYWHYEYFPKDKANKYYMLIDRCDQYFDTLKELQNWARPLYFQ